MTVQFAKATKAQARLRLAIGGPAGSGKTKTALRVACALAEADGKRVAYLDTEHGSASKYADEHDFDTLNLDAPYHPDRYVEAIRAAQAAGYGVLVLDSLSHAWNGAGGLLEIVDEIAKRQRTTNSFTAWKDATPIQHRLVNALLSADLHIIATMRSKQEYVLEKDEKTGKTAPRKVGMAPVQREGVEYEFDIFGEMDQEHTMVVTKSRCPALSDAVLHKPGEDLAATLREWLTDGEPDPRMEIRSAITRELERIGSIGDYSEDVQRGIVAARDFSESAVAPLDRLQKALAYLQAIETSTQTVEA